MEANELINIDIADAIIDKPFAFEVNGKTLYIYPLTLGKQMLLSRLYSQLQIDQDSIVTNTIEEVLNICSTNKELVCRILAYHTLSKKSEVLDIQLVNKRTKYLSKHLDTADLAKLAFYILQDNRINDFLAHFGIDREQKEQQKVMRVKKDKHSISFGGLSPWGSLIDRACERYGWTFDYVVWGISFINLSMMLADSVNTIYLSDEERKKAHITNDRTFINGDDPKNMERIRAMFKD